MEGWGESDDCIFESSGGRSSLRNASRSQPRAEETVVEVSCTCGANTRRDESSTTITGGGTMHSSMGAVTWKGSEKDGGDGGGDSVSGQYNKTNAMIKCQYAEETCLAIGRSLIERLIRARSLGEMAIDGCGCSRCGGGLADCGWCCGWAVEGVVQCGMEE